VTHTCMVILFTLELAMWSIPHLVGSIHVEEVTVYVRECCLVTTTCTWLLVYDSPYSHE